VLLPYHLRLAVRSLRRDAGLSATIVVVLAVAAGTFSTAVMHYLRTYGQAGALPDSAHQVEIIERHATLDEAFENSNNAPNITASRTRVSFPMYRVLAGAGLGTRQVGTYRARVMVGASGDGRERRPLKVVNARFTGGDLFGLFGLRFRGGGAWPAADEAGGAPVVVLGPVLNDLLFDGANSVGRTVMVDDREFRVVGVLADEQPFSPEWDRTVTGGPQDQLYLPFDEGARLHARPEAAIAEQAIGPSYGELLGAHVVAVAFWIDLPLPALRDRYAAYLEEQLGRRGIRYKLRDLPVLRAELGPGKTVMTFFVFVTFLVLLGAGLVTMRLLLAKSLTRQGELSIFRAVGAPRGALVARQLLEAALLALLGGVAATAVAGPFAFLYNRLVGDTDISLRVTPTSFAVTLAATVAVGTAAALYPAWRAAARRPTMSAMSRVGG
jgi:putative ABC transport system permease protein